MQSVPIGGFADAWTVARLRAGDEAAFAALVESLGPSLLRLARALVPGAVADEVVQDTWLGVVTGIDRFEGRSSLRTWIFRILTNRAKTRALRERRAVPFSSLVGDDVPSVDAERFLSTGNGLLTHHWSTPPETWETPEERLLSAETLATIRDAIGALPPAQRAVITLRDVEGWGAREVCEVLDLSAGNQRLLLHRARTRVRAALDRELAPRERDYRRDSLSTSPPAVGGS